MLRVGVLASGSGTNFQALQDACACGYAPARIAVVVSNRAGASVLERARCAGVEAVFADPAGSCSREEYDKQLRWYLEQAGVDLVCGAGYMRMLSTGFVHAFQGRVLNIHPSLLPAFPGLHAMDQAWDAGVKVSGVTVHMVDEGLDTGPIVAQRAVQVGTDRADFQRRIHLAEYSLYPSVLKAWAEGLVAIDGRRVILGKVEDPPWAGSVPPGLE